MAEASPTMETMLARTWWAPVLKGAIAIVFGLVVWFWPGLALQTVILIFAIYAICSGILNMAEAVLSVADRERWIPLALEGALSMGAGTVALVWPDLAAKTFLILVAIWAILTGVLNLVSAVRLRDEISDEWLLVLIGLAGIIFGTVAIARPQSGALAVLWLIGAFGIIFGALTIAMGMRMRKSQLQLTAGEVVESGSNSANPLDSSTMASDLPSSQQAAAMPTPRHVDAATSAAVGVEGGRSNEDSTSSTEVSRYPNRRERALNELVSALPPEGEGWRRGDGGLTPPEGYPLKGNINSRIYHAPGGQSYHETIAEVYFATDEVAQRVGFRPRKEPDRGASESRLTDAVRASELPDSQPTPVGGLDLADDQIIDLDVQPTNEQIDSVDVDGDSSLETPAADPVTIIDVRDDLGGSGDDNGRAAYESFEEAELATFDAELNEAIEESLTVEEEPGGDNAETDASIPPALPTSIDSERTADSNDSVLDDAFNASTHEDATSEPDSDPAVDGITIFETAAQLTTSVETAPTADEDSGETSLTDVEYEHEDPETTLVDAASDPRASEEDANVGAVDEHPQSSDADKAPIDAELEALLASLAPEGTDWVRGDGEYDCPEDFPIKGNISSMIYHVPGGGSYSATIPGICFSTTDIAEEAGFRGARNKGSLTD